jgi:hypothetical protein
MPPFVGYRSKFAETDWKSAVVVIYVNIKNKNEGELVNKGNFSST